MLLTLLLQTTGTNFTLIAAIVAACAALVSASISAFIALKGKEKEFKNDYYKKIIDKRIKAIEHAEALINLFRPFKTMPNDLSYHTYFIKKLQDDDYLEALNAVIEHSLWFSSSTLYSLKQFNIVFRPIKAKAKTFKEESDLKNFAAENFDAILKRMIEVQGCIGRDMHNLHDVSGFLHSKFNPDGDITTVYTTD